MEGVIGERFACVDCGLLCGGEEEFRRHLELECGTRPRVECPECPFRTIWEEALESHWLRKHGDQGPAFVCTGCGDGFSSSVDITAHLRLYCSRLSKKTFPCSKCDRVCTSNAGLTRHSIKCAGQFKCLSCPFRSATKQNLRSHIRSRHGPEVLAIYDHVMAHNIDFTCFDCDRKFNTKSRLEVHLWERCAKEAKFECPVCFKRLYDWHLRQAHMVKTHGEDSLRMIRQAKIIDKPYQCHNCKKGFATEKSISQHLTGCGKPPTQQCPECPYIAHFYNTLAKHLQEHHGVDAYERYKLQLRARKAFPCPHCERAFTANSGLIHHLKYDCGYSSKCPECPAVLNTRSNLRAHVLSKHGRSALAKIMPPVKEHHGVDALECYKLQRKLELRASKAFPCPHCERAFSAQPNLLKHLRHDCGKLHKCPECPAVLNARSSLRNHVLRRHGRGALAKIALKVAD